GSLVVPGGSTALPMTGGAAAIGGAMATTAGGGSGSNACTGQTKACNGSCIPLTACCGGCSGNTPICNNGTCVSRPDGDACTIPTECASKVCADGVCCDVACDGQCEACNLDTSKGSCTPTTTQRATNPCASDGTLCGGTCDGTAEHRKSCVYSPNSTLCGPGPSCNTTTNQTRTAQLCNGSGLCKSPEVKNCAPFTCNGAVCGSDCPDGQGVCGGSCVDILSDAAHCGGSCLQCPGSTPRCSAGACVQCVVGADCPSLGYGEGSICTSNHTCRCREPSAGNLLKNPGFDTSLANWTTSPCEGCASQPHGFSSNHDADGCSASGAVMLTYYTLASSYVAQCVPFQPNTNYNFGFAFMQQDATSINAIRCVLNQYSGSTCSGSTISSNVSLSSGNPPSSGNWSGAKVYFRSEATAGSVEIKCGHYDYSTKTWMDHVYLNTEDTF
ncbi:MAG TPA: hypothetical protein VKP30_13125, partial [Polyangiaceae bacterium]|nr:hypothetical protein [Polyangiaceae bacterium]